MFSLSLRRIQRLAFLLRTVALVVLGFAVFFLILLVPEEAITTETWEVIGYVLTFGFYLAWLFYAVAPRCRDIGLPSWAAAAMFLPVVNLFLFVVFLSKKSEESDEEADPAARANAAQRTS